METRLPNSYCPEDYSIPIELWFNLEIDKSTYISTFKLQIVVSVLMNPNKLHSSNIHAHNIHAHNILKHLKQ